ncbi:MAG TPA: metallophosphoesterase, partial [Segetibacter sp.]
MNKQTQRWGIAGGSVVAGYLLLKAVLLEKYFFEVNTFDIGKNFGSTTKLLLLTDLHFRKWLWPFHQKLAKKINDLKPDLILIAGDIIDESGTTTNAAGQFLRKINFTIPKAVILGNHDFKNAVSFAAYKQIFKESNCTFLQNQTEVFNIKGTKVAVTGIEDFIEGFPDVSKALQGVGTEKNHVLLVHSPAQHEEVMREVSKINEC